MTSRIIVSMANIQTLEHDGKSWSEKSRFGITFWNDALSTGWFKKNFGGRDIGDLGVLCGIMFHARPLDGEDLDLLVQLNMAMPEDKGRLYARVTDVALSDELGMHRVTIHACADRLAEKGLIQIVPIPDEMVHDQKFRDSKGKFTGSRIYLVSGTLHDAMTKEIGSQLLPQQVVHVDSTAMDAETGTAQVDSTDMMYNVGDAAHVESIGTGGDFAGDHVNSTNMGEGSANSHVELTDMDDRGQNDKNNPKNTGHNAKNRQEGPDRVGPIDINESLRSVNAMSVCMDESIIHTDINSDSAKKSAVCTALLNVGVFAEAVPELVGTFDLDLIMAWVALYSEEFALEMVQGPGWLVRALRENWSLEREQYRIKCARQKRDAAARTVVPATPAPSNLPENILGDLQEIGWEDTLAFVETMWRSNQPLVDAWLDYVFERIDELENPAGRFRAGLASGETPPIGRKRKKDEDDRSRYVTGAYAEYIQH